MKLSLTLLSMILAGTAGLSAQTHNFKLPAHYRTDAAKATLALQVGSASVLKAQRLAGTGAKTAATSYRLTGWSRFDISNSAYTDSTSFSYSGTRGSRFADEQENLRGGDWWSLSSPDRFYSSKDGGPDDGTEIVQKYNSGDQVREQIFRMADFSSKSVSTYNTNGSIASLVEFDSTSIGWIASRRYTYIYDAAGRRSTDNIFDLQNSVPLGKVTYHYDAAGRQDTMQSAAWDGAGWYTDYLLVNTFNAAGLTESTTNYYLNEDLDLQPGERFEFGYDAAKRLSTTVTSRYDEGNWHLQLRDSLGYTGTKALYTLMRSELWDEDQSSWSLMREWSYSLNADFRWSIEWFKTPGSSGLEYQTKTLISYNPSGLVSKTESYTYDRTQQQFPLTANETEHFWYESVSTTGVPAQQAPLQVKLHPNPASSIVHIEIPGKTIRSAEVFSSMGQRVLQQQGGATQINVSALPAGTYFLNVQLDQSGAPAPIRFVKI